MPAVLEELKAKAEAGDAEAQYELSWRSALGHGLAADETAAVYWLTKAAQGGHALAQNNLGARCLAGDGVPRDRVAAFCWFQLAAEAGDRKAGKNRDTAAAEMTAEETERAGHQLLNMRAKAP